MRNTFFTLGGIVLVSVAAALYFLAFRFDGVVETQIERAATMALGARVEVGGVTTNLREGTLSVEQISVANPPGFDNPYAVQLNAVEAALDYEGLEVKQLVIENPTFFVEEKDGKINFDEILKELEAEADGATQTQEREIVIRHLRIDETNAAFQSQSFDHYSDIKVDAIEMHDLRGTPTALARQIAREVVSEISSEAATEMMKTKAKNQVDDVQSKNSSTVKEMRGSEDEEEG
jgi:hypothetical protein